MANPLNPGAGGSRLPSIPDIVGGVKNIGKNVLGNVAEGITAELTRQLPMGFQGVLGNNSPDGKRNQTSTSADGKVTNKQVLDALQSVDSSINSVDKGVNQFNQYMWSSLSRQAQMATALDKIVNKLDDISKNIGNNSGSILDNAGDLVGGGKGKGTPKPNPNTTGRVSGSRLGTLGKWASRGALGLGAGLEAYDTYNRTGDGLAAASAGGGALAGGWGGATAGAAVGSMIFPGVGTTIGGLVGGAAGMMAGSSIGQKGYDFFKTYSPTQQLNEYGAPVYTPMPTKPNSLTEQNYDTLRKAGENPTWTTPKGPSSKDLDDIEKLLKEDPLYKKSSFSVGDINQSNDISKSKSSNRSFTIDAQEFTINTRSFKIDGVDIGELFKSMAGGRSGTVAGSGFQNANYTINGQGGGQTGSGGSGLTQGAPIPAGQGGYNATPNSRPSVYDPSSTGSGSGGSGGFNSGGKRGAIGGIGSGGSAVAVGGQKDRMRMVYDAYRKAGFDHDTAKSFTAEIGRENDYNPNIMFGVHRDPHNGAVNAGMMSWQKDRGEKMLNYLKERNLLNADGSMKRTQEAVDAMAMFSKEEMTSGALGKRGKAAYDVLMNPNASHEDRARVLGDDVIKWRRTDPRYAHHAQKRDRYYNQIENVSKEERGSSVAISSGSVSNDGTNRVREETQGKTRDLQIKGELRDKLNYAATQTGVEVVVTSGGQLSHGSKRTGSHRHDVDSKHMGAADIKLMKRIDGKSVPLDMTNKEDMEIVNKFTTEAYRAGVTGIGAGPEYMGKNTFHFGGGSDTQWGSGAGWIAQAKAEGRRMGMVDVNEWKKQEIAKQQVAKQEGEKVQSDAQPEGMKPGFQYAAYQPNGSMPFFANQGISQLPKANPFGGLRELPTVSKFTNEQFGPHITDFNYAQFMKSSQQGIKNLENQMWKKNMSEIDSGIKQIRKYTDDTNEITRESNRGRAFSNTKTKKEVEDARELERENNRGQALSRLSEEKEIKDRNEASAAKESVKESVEKSEKTEDKSEKKPADAGLTKKELEEYFENNTL